MNRRERARLSARAAARTRTRASKGQHDETFPLCSRALEKEDRANKCGTVTLPDIAADQHDGIAAADAGSYCRARGQPRRAAAVTRAECSVRRRWYRRTRPKRGGRAVPALSECVRRGCGSRVHRKLRCCIVTESYDTAWSQKAAILYRSFRCTYHIVDIDDTGCIARKSDKSKILSVSYHTLRFVKISCPSQAQYDTKDTI